MKNYRDTVIYKKNRQRPKFLNLLQIRLPVTAVASILHRVSGVILLMVLPVVIYGLDLSLQGREGFEQVISMIQSPVGQLVFVLISTSIFYHLIAGIRFLLLDVDIGYSLAAARWTARIVIIISIIVMLVLVTGVFIS